MDQETLDTERDMQAPNWPNNTPRYEAAAEDRSDKIMSVAAEPAKVKPFLWNVGWV